MLTHNKYRPTPSRVSDDDDYVYDFSLRGKNKEYFD